MKLNDLRSILRGRLQASRNVKAIAILELLEDIQQAGPDVLDIIISMAHPDRTEAVGLGDCELQSEQQYPSTCSPWEVPERITRLVCSAPLDLSKTYRELSQWVARVDPRVGKGDPIIRIWHERGL